MYKKGTSKKVYIAILLLIILIVSTVAIVYATQFSKSGAKNGVVGVHVGDTFTYKLTGTSVLGSVDAVTPAFLSIYNDTDYYKVTVTGINGTIVSFTTDWKYLNGTDLQESKWVDVSTGARSDQILLLTIYPSNLNVNDLLSPKGFDGLTVNATDSKIYADSTRARNFFQAESQFRDMNDPTGNTQRLEYDGIYFDKQTGMLVSLTNIEYYNNPQYNLIITSQLTSTNVWAVQ